MTKLGTKCAAESKILSNLSSGFGMKNRVEEGMRTKDGPTPGENFASRGNESNHANFVVANEMLKEIAQRIHAALAILPESWMRGSIATYNRSTSRLMSRNTVPINNT